MKIKNIPINSDELIENVNKLISGIQYKQGSPEEKASVEMAENILSVINEMKDKREISIIKQEILVEQENFKKAQKMLNDAYQEKHRIRSIREKREKEISDLTAAAKEAAKRGNVDDTISLGKILSKKEEAFLESDIQKSYDDAREYLDKCLNLKNRIEEDLEQMELRKKELEN